MHSFLSDCSAGVTEYLRCKAKLLVQLRSKNHFWKCFKHLNFWNTYLALCVPNTIIEIQLNVTKHDQLVTNDQGMPAVLRMNLRHFEDFNHVHYFVFSYEFLKSFLM